ncbi:MAG: MMPL family transporter [Clostridia bacterium]|nr:MMPL family transporter [Clostridia bacterium]
MLDKFASAIGKFCYRFRYIVVAVGILLFAFVCWYQTKAEISYTNTSAYNEVVDVFPEDTLVIVYGNDDESNMQAVANGLLQDENVASVQGYYNTLGMELTPEYMASTAGIDVSFINILYYMYEYGTQTDGLDLVTFVNFISSEAFLNNKMFSSMIDDDTSAAIQGYAYMVNGIYAGTNYSAAELAAMFGSLGADEATISYMFSAYGVETMTISGFVNTMYENAADEESKAALLTYVQLCGAVQSGTKLTAADVAAMFAGQSESFTESTVNLLFVLYYAQTTDMSAVTIGLYDFFMFLCDDILTDETFSGLMSDEQKATLSAYKETLVSGKAQLVGEDYSRIIVTINYVMESDEIYEFYDNLTATLDDTLSGEYYLVGESAMSYELSQTFRSEYTLISVVTALLIFAVICLTFRKFSVPVLLVCLIECAVFVTMSVMAISGTAMYFIALIIVQCILMGSMVDYGILLSSYYKEVRRELPKEQALPEVMKRAYKAILTSALVMIAVTFILGAAMTGAVGDILLTLGVGTLSALILIMFVLPSLLAVCDKAVTWQWKGFKKKAEQTEDVIEVKEEGTEVTEQLEEREE